MPQDSIRPRTVNASSVLPVWRQLAGESLGDCCLTIFEEIWQRTQGPEHTYRSTSAAALHYTDRSWASFIGAMDACDDETFAQVQLALRVGWALHATLDRGILGQEPWLQEVMRFLGLCALSPDERERFKRAIDATFFQLEALRQADRIVGAQEGWTG